MNTKKFKKASVHAAVYKNTVEGDILVLEEASKWISDGKYQMQENILLEPATGEYWLYMLTRSGSPFTDYCYSFEWEEDRITLVEVFKTTKIVAVWRPVE